MNQPPSRISAVKKELIWLSLMIPVIFVSGRLVVGSGASEPASAASPVPTIPQSTPVAEITPTSSSTIRPAVAGANNSSTDPAAAAVSLSLIAPSGESSWQLNLTPQIRTVADLMTAAATQGLLTMDTKNYGGSLGLFVEAINGLPNDYRSDTYWLLYVNDQAASLGMSSIDINPGDVISWRYEISRP